MWLLGSAEQVFEHEMGYRVLKKMCSIRESLVGHVDNNVAAARGAKTDRKITWKPRAVAGTGIQYISLDVGAANVCSTNATQKHLEARQ
jgi:hypothetical protein